MYILSSAFLFFSACHLIEGLSNFIESHDLPLWVTTNPAYQNPISVDSLISGGGSIVCNNTSNLSWIIQLNSEAGYGVDVILNQLSLGTDNDDYLMISAWPILKTEFKEIKLFTGSFNETQHVRILNSKHFFVLFNAASSKIPPKLTLTYKRYGSPYCSRSPSVDKPVKKETLYEVHLVGKKPQEYADSDFQMQIKGAIMAAAAEYCMANNIKFNSSIPVNEMVLFNKISLCPTEWPERDLCASLEHSVFVSGDRIPGESIIINYELTSEHLRDMWLNGELEEIKKLGIEVFELPLTADVIIYWSVFIGMIVLSSLLMIIIFWKIEIYSKQKRKGDSLNSGDSEMINLNKKPISPKNQQIPSVMLKANGSEQRAKYDEFTSKSTDSDNFLSNKEKPEIPSSSPIKSYFGSILFSSNKAFEDDGDLGEIPP